MPLLSSIGLPDAELVERVALRIGVPASLVRAYACPECGMRAFAGFLAPRTYLQIKCSKSNCPHNSTRTPWVVAEGWDRNTRPRLQLDLLRCPGDVCGHPWSPGNARPFAYANYANGRAVCKRPWARGIIGRGTRIVVWCKQTTCIYHKDGFTILPS